MEIWAHLTAWPTVSWCIDTHKTIKHIFSLVVGACIVNNMNQWGKYYCLNMGLLYGKSWKAAVWTLLIFLSIFRDPLAAEKSSWQTHHTSPPCLLICIVANARVLAHSNSLYAPPKAFLHRLLLWSNKKHGTKIGFFTTIRISPWLIYLFELSLLHCLIYLSRSRLL